MGTSVRGHSGPESRDIPDKSLRKGSEPWQRQEKVHSHGDRNIRALLQDRLSGELVIPMPPRFFKLLRADELSAVKPKMFYIFYVFYLNFRKNIS